MTYVVTTVITLIATDDAIVVRVIIIVNVVTSVAMYTFPIAKASQMKPKTTICPDCEKFCCGRCSFMAFIPARVGELLWTFVYSGVTEVGCIIFLYTLPNATSLIQTYIATAWMQRHAMSSVKNLEHANYMDTLLTLLSDFSKEQRSYDGKKMPRKVDALQFVNYTFNQLGVKVVNMFSYIFKAGGVYWINGKTELESQCFFVL